MCVCVLSPHQTVISFVSTYPGQAHFLCLSSSFLWLNCLDFDPCETHPIHRNADLGALEQTRDENHSIFHAHILWALVSRGSNCSFLCLS